MYVAMLIREFQKLETLPVEVKLVEKYLKDANIVDEIEYIGVDINAKILRGMNITTVNTTKPSLGMSAPKFNSDIYYANSLDDAGKRLGQCKELIHILDPEGCRTANRHDLETLVERIVLPQGLVNPLEEDGIQAAIDRIAILQAMALLFPLAARELLLPKLNDGKLDLEDIAAMADLPLPNVAVVMSPFWLAIHEQLRNMKWPPGQVKPDPSGQA